LIAYLDMIVEHLNNAVGDVLVRRNVGALDPRGPDLLSPLAMCLDWSVKQSTGRQVFDRTRFDGDRVPKMSLIAYMTRLRDHLEAPPFCFLAAYFYIERLSRRNGQSLRVRSTNVHRLVLTSLLIASKFFEER
jgi:hypothetical protein